MSDGQNPTLTPTTPTPEPAAVAPPSVPEPASPPEPKSVLDAPKEPEAPVAFDPEKLTLPEGFDAKTPAFEEFTQLAKDAGMTGDVAQKLVDFHLKHTQEASKALMDNWAATQEEWVNQVKSDKEIGNLDNLRQTIAKVADNQEFTDPEFKSALAFTGAGNHPAILRTLYRWAKALGEGGPVAGGAPARAGNGALANNPPSAAEAIYGPGGPHTGGPKLS